MIWPEDVDGRGITMTGPLRRGKGTAPAAPSRGESVQRALKGQTSLQCRFTYWKMLAHSKDRST